MPEAKVRTLAQLADELEWRRQCSQAYLTMLAVNAGWTGKPDILMSYIAPAERDTRSAAEIIAATIAADKERHHGD